MSKYIVYHYYYERKFINLLIGSVDMILAEFSLIFCFSVSVDLFEQMTNDLSI